VSALLTPKVTVINPPQAAIVATGCNLVLSFTFIYGALAFGAGSRSDPLKLDQAADCLCLFPPA